MARTLDSWLEEQAFHVPTVIEMFAIIQDARNTLGFHTPEDNLTLIHQAKIVTENFRDFVFDLKEPILDVAKKSSAEALLDELAEQHERLDKYPEFEDDALFYVIRDVWMVQLMQLVAVWINNDGNVDEIEGGIDG